MIDFIQDFTPENNFCTKCKLHTTSDAPFLGGRGDINSQVLVLCDTPTKNDSILKEPFSASFGESIERDLKLAGFSSYYLSYIVRCHNTKKTLKVQSKCCYPITIELIKQMKPKVIIALGRSVLEHLNGISISEEVARQKEFFHPELNTNIIVTFNPRKYMGDNSILFNKWYQDDLKFAYEVFNRPLKRVLASKPRSLRTSEEIVQYLNHLLHVEEFAFDIETAKVEDISFDVKSLVVPDSVKALESDFSDDIAILPNEKQEDAAEDESEEDDASDKEDSVENAEEEDAKYTEFKHEVASKGKKKVKEFHNPRIDKITDISFCSKPGEGVHIRWEDILPHLDLFRQVMAGPAKKIGHHVEYDCEFLECASVPVNNVYFDTEKAFHTLTASYEGGKAKGLYKLKVMDWFLTTAGGYNDVLEEFGGIAGYQNVKKRNEVTELSAKKRKKKGDDQVQVETSSAGRLPLEIVKKLRLNKLLEENANFVLNRKLTLMHSLGLNQGEFYSAMDSDVTLRIKNKLKPLIDEQFDFVYYNNRIPLIKSLMLMRMTGVALDVTHAFKIKEENFKAAYLERQAFYEAIGGKINLSSVKQLQEAMFKTLGIKPNPKFKTKTGNSTNEKAITFYSQQYPILKHILNYRGYLKANSTYIDGFLRHIDPTDNRIHPSGLQISTATGRLSFTDPPVQTVPKDNLYRNMFIPRPGWKFVTADLSQAELRFVAMLADDKEMIEAFVNGYDLHRYTACKMLLHKDYEDYDEHITEHKKARNIAKCVDPNTLIIVNNRFIRIKDVLQGGCLDSKDKFYDVPTNTNVYDGDKHNIGIKSYYINNPAERYLIITRRGILVCSANHKIQSEDGSLIRAEDIKKGDAVKYSETPFIEGEVHSIKYNPFFEDSTTSVYNVLMNEDWAYFAGMFTGDGCWGGKYISISAGGDEKFYDWRNSIIQSCAKVGFKAVEHIHTKTDGKKIASIYIGSSKVRRFIEYIGLASKRAKTLQVPHWVLNGTPDIKKAFLSGLIDTDGTISGSGFGITSKSWLLMQDLSVLCSSLGYSFTLGIDHNKTYNKDYYRLYIRSVSAFDLLESGHLKCAWKVSSIKEKKDRSIEANQKVFSLHKGNEVLKVTKLGCGDLVDIEVDSSEHLYQANTFITHNTINFGILYGLSARSLAEQVTEALYKSWAEDKEKGKEVPEHPDVLTMEDAEFSIEAWFELYSGVANWINESKKFASTHGYIETLYGRRRYLPYINSANQGIKEAELRKSANTPVQGGANEITLMALNKLTKYILDNNMQSRPVLIIHDEIVVECPPEEVEDIKEKLVMFMTKDVPRVTIPLVADPAVLDRWNK